MNITQRSKTAGIYYLTAGDITLVLTPDALEKIYFDTYSAIHDRKPLTTTN